MNSTKQQPKKTLPQIKNPLEIDNSRAKAQDNYADLLFGAAKRQAREARSEYGNVSDYYPAERRPQAPRQKPIEVFTSAVDTQTRLIPKHIEALSKQLEDEIHILKKRSNEFSSEVEQVEKQTIQSLPEKAGIYHVRFLELMISLVQSVSAKVTEAKTWLSAMQTKKAKRGSLFAARSKKQGTQYSLSQELQSSRSVM